MRRLNDLEDTTSKMSFFKSQKLLAGALALVFVAGMASPAFASLNIDTMDFGPTADAANSGTPVDGSNESGPLNEIILGDRTTLASYGMGPLQIMIDRVDVGPVGILALSSDVATKGDFLMTYDDNGAGLGGIDFLAEGGLILVELFSVNQAASMKITIMDTVAGSSSLTIPIPLNDNTDLTFLFANFVGTADLTDVDKVEVLVVGQLDGDYSIDNISIPQTRVGGTVGSMSTTSLLVAGAQANMGLWSLALVGVVAAGAAIIYKTKSKKTEQ